MGWPWCFVRIHVPFTLVGNIHDLSGCAYCYQTLKPIFGMDLFQVFRQSCLAHRPSRVGSTITRVASTGRAPLTLRNCWVSWGEPSRSQNLLEISRWRGIAVFAQAVTARAEARPPAVPKSCGSENDKGRDVPATFGLLPVVFFFETAECVDVNACISSYGSQAFSLAPPGGITITPSNHVPISCPSRLLQSQAKVGIFNVP